ncbi:MAG TPA: PH domain-containing protein [Streptosporangiaceae bacterium]|jgi:hypothetical protein|nr:PH domain-containing protein [Streptosporangiaceae bacterium]
MSGADDDLQGAAGVSMRALIGTEDETESGRHFSVTGGEGPELDDGDDDWAFTIPPGIARFLKPDETKVIPVRRHPALLALPGLAVVGGLAAAVALNSWLYETGHASGAVVHPLWWLYLIAFAWGAYRWLDWRQTWFVITGHRIVLIEAVWVLGRKVTMLPINKMRDVKLEQPVFGRLFGYGSLDFASIGTEGALDRVDCLPWPEWLYRHICDLSMPETERHVVKKTGGGAA